MSNLPNISCIIYILDMPGERFSTLIGKSAQNINRFAALKQFAQVDCQLRDSKRICWPVVEPRRAVWIRKQQPGRLLFEK